MQAEMTKKMLANFNDPAAVAQYTEGPLRFVPAFADLHRMTAILLGERAPGNAEGAREMVAAHLDLLSPEEDEAVLREAGFSGVAMFYAAFTHAETQRRLLRLRREGFAFART